MTALAPYISCMNHTCINYGWDRVEAKVLHRNFIFFWNITMVNIIIEKGNKLPSQWREKYRQKRVLPSSAEHKRQATFPETNTEVLTRNFSRIDQMLCLGALCRWPSSLGLSCRCSDRRCRVIRGIFLLGSRGTQRGRQWTWMRWLKCL